MYSFSTLLYDKILNNADNRAIQKSSVNGFLFIENNFVINSSDTTKWIFHNIDKLTITYVLYITENNKEYNFIIQNISAKANSEADYEKKR